VSLRYTAQALGPNGLADACLAMLLAPDAAGVDTAMAGWVDPTNNMLAADTAGGLRYLTRGKVPERPAANGWLPVPGWEAAHEWAGVALDVKVILIPPCIFH
jgi:acyl-homoserine lactone acylase PvdQ